MYVCMYVCTYVRTSTYIRIYVTQRRVEVRAPDRGGQVRPVCHQKCSLMEGLRARTDASMQSLAKINGMAPFLELHKEHSLKSPRNGSDMIRDLEGRITGNKQGHATRGYIDESDRQ